MRNLIVLSLVGTLVGLGLGCNKVSEPDDSAGGASPGVGSNSGASAGGAGKGGEGGATTGGAGSGEPDCFEDPKTHYEIINACTSATRVEKKPKLRLLNEDGSLPEL